MIKSKLSIIVSCISNTNGLKQTLDSISSQKNLGFQLIVVYCAENTDTLNILKNYEEIIDESVLTSEDSIIGELNRAIKRVEGEYVLFLESGDILCDENVIQSISSLPLTTDLVYGNLQVMTSETNSDVLLMPETIDIRSVFYLALPSSIILIRRSLFEKYGFFDENLRSISYWTFIFRLIAFTNITRKHIPVTIASMRENIFKRLTHETILEERRKVISESFSFEILEMFDLYDNYRSFYQKKIFRIGRRFSLIIKNLFRPSYWSELIHRRRFQKLIYLLNKTVRKQQKDTLSIPIIIINYNRLADLKKLISFLLDRNHKNIIVVDNQSSYPPLLEYYKEIQDRVRVEIMDKNYGHLVFWRNERLQKEYGKGYYIITDSDILPNKDMPIDYIEQMMYILDQHKEWTKLGLALQINDLPDYLKIKDKVINWESKFWEDEIQPNLFRGQVDTTFALYPPRYKYDIGNFLNGGRIAGNFTAKHGGWYIDIDNMTDEERYYYETANSSNSWKLNKEGDHIGSNEY